MTCKFYELFVNERANGKQSSDIYSLDNDDVGGNLSVSPVLKYPLSKPLSRSQCSWIFQELFVS